MSFCTDGFLEIFRSRFPDGTAKLIPAGSDLIFNIHYAPSAEEASDRSSIKLYFAKKPVDHLIKSFYIREDDIANGPFIIRANEKPKFYVSKTIQEDMHVVSLLPHMHFLGKNMTAVAITPDQQEIPLIRINDWDFNWQSTYLLEEALFLPKGTVLLLVAEYDNTSDNPLNPVSPPQRCHLRLGFYRRDDEPNLLLLLIKKPPFWGRLFFNILSFIQDKGLKAFFLVP
jgi:hypothetical protein